MQFYMQKDNLYHINIMQFNQSMILVNVRQYACEAVLTVAPCGLFHNFHSKQTNALIKSNPLFFFNLVFFACIAHDTLILFIFCSVLFHLIFTCFAHDDYAFNFPNNLFLFLLLQLHFFVFCSQ